MTLRQGKREFLLDAGPAEKGQAAEVMILFTIVEFLQAGNCALT